MRRILVSLCVLQAYSISTWAEEPGTTDRAPLELQATDIVGTSDFETAQGPVKGYHATRSASATRTDTAIHETPQSISVVSRDVVEDLSATRLQDALDYAGGVGRESRRAVTRRSGRPRPGRGAGPGSPRLRPPSADRSSRRRPTARARAGLF